jgi:hypothetical protein
MVYLYAICRDLPAAAIGELTGVNGEPVRPVRNGDLVAIVGAVSAIQFGEQALRDNLEDLGWVEAVVRAHHAVAEAVAVSAPTAPARAATVFRDDDRVLTILRDREAELHRLLGQLAGHREWGVKVYALPSATSGDDLHRTAPGETASPGTAYLLGRKAQQDRRHQAAQRLADQVDGIDSSLAACAVATRHHRPQNPRLTGESGAMMLNAAYLVAAGQTARFTAAADRLAGELTGARLTVTGPWPAYSFATLPDLS